MLFERAFATFIQVLEKYKNIFTALDIQVWKMDVLYRFETPVGAYICWSRII